MQEDQPPPPCRGRARVHLAPAPRRTLHPPDRRKPLPEHRDRQVGRVAVDGDHLNGLRRVRVRRIGQVGEQTIQLHRVAQHRDHDRGERPPRGPVGRHCAHPGRPTKGATSVQIRSWLRPSWWSSSRRTSRTCGRPVRPARHHRGFDHLVAVAMQDEGRDRGLRLERVVPCGVAEQRVVHARRLAGRVVRQFPPAGLTPQRHPHLAQLAYRDAAEVECRRQEHQPRDRMRPAAAPLIGRMERRERAEARSEQRDRPGRQGRDEGGNLRDDPRHG